ncbi:MAG TPA: hypothetical protein VIM57_02170 [Luteolibacter sp.]
MKFRLLTGALGVAMSLTGVVQAQEPVPVIDNPLYLGWPQVVGTKARFDRVTRVSGPLLTPDEVTKSVVTYELVKITPEELTIETEGGRFIIPARTNPKYDLKSGDPEDVRVGANTYTCQVYHYKTTSAAEIGRDPQGQTADVVVWLNIVAPTTVVRRRWVLKLDSTYTWEETWQGASVPAPPAVVPAPPVNPAPLLTPPGTPTE